MFVDYMKIEDEDEVEMSDDGGGGGSAGLHFSALILAFRLFVFLFFSILHSTVDRPFGLQAEHIITTWSDNHRKTRMELAKNICVANLRKSFTKTIRAKRQSAGTTITKRQIKLVYQIFNVQFTI